MPHDARDVNAGELRRQRIRGRPAAKLPNSPLAVGRFLLYSPGALARVLKNRASRHDPALCGFYKCSSAAGGLSLSKTPHALADSLMLVF